MTRRLKYLMCALFLMTCVPAGLVIAADAPLVTAARKGKLASAGDSEWKLTGTVTKVGDVFVLKPSAPKNTFPVPGPLKIRVLRVTTTTQDQMVFLWAELKPEGEKPVVLPANLREGDAFVIVDVEIINQESRDVEFMGYGLVAETTAGRHLDLRLRDDIGRLGYKPGEKVRLSLVGREVAVWVPVEGLSRVIPRGKSRYCQLLLVQESPKKGQEVGLLVRYGQGAPISVQDVTTATTTGGSPSPPAAPTLAADRGRSPPAPSDLQKYFDPASGLSLSYPGTWKQMTPAEARRLMGGATSQYLTVVIYDPNDRTQNVNVQVLPTAAKDLSEASYTEFAKEMDRRMPSDFPGFWKLSSRVGPLRDMASLEYVFEATRPDGVRLRQKQLRTGKPGREVAITFTAPAAAYDKADETCFKVIGNTLRLD